MALPQSNPTNCPVYPWLWFGWEELQVKGLQGQDTEDLRRQRVTGLKGVTILKEFEES